MAERKGSQTWMDFARKQEHLWNRWLDSLDVDHDYAKLESAIIMCY
jgi:hypothetical protein